MSWKLVPATLRHVVLSLLRSSAATSPTIFLNNVRRTSQFSSSPNPSAFDVRDIFSKALDTNGSRAGSKTPAEIWADKSKNLRLVPPPDTWTGRRLVVRDGDLHDAFQQLNFRLRQNHVAKEVALTVRHEKKGDKRARLRSERWRKRFADAVRKKVQLVSTIRRRGG